MTKNIVYIIALLLPSVLEVSAADLSKHDIKNIALQIHAENKDLLRSANIRLLYAIKNNDTQSAGQAILQGASLNGFSSSGGRFIVPLIEAVNVQSHDTVSFLVAMGADIDQQDKEGKTALLRAVKSNDKNMVQLLLDLNADVNIVDNYGSTPLMYAAKEGIVQLLIDAKANLNAQDICGYTALLHALSRGCFDVAKLLINAGADINVANALGNTPLTYTLKRIQDYIEANQDSSGLKEIKCVMKEKILENIEKTTNIEDRIALQDQLKQLD